MNARVIVILITCLAEIAFCQEQNIHKEFPKQSRTLNYGNWVGKRVMTTDFMTRVGIQGAQAKNLKEPLDAIDLQLKTIDEKINQAALQQAEIAKKVLSEPGANVDEIMSIIEKIGKLRTDQAKLSTQMLVVIRDSLTADQREKATALIAAEGQKRIKERMARREREERERNGNAQPPTRPNEPKGW